MIKFNMGYSVKQCSCDEWLNDYFRGVIVDKNIHVEELNLKIKKMMNKKEVFGGKKLEEDSEAFKKIKVHLMYCSKILKKEVGEKGTLLEFWKKIKDPDIEKKVKKGEVYELEQGMQAFALLDKK